jgi:hypothetical protein
MFIESPHVRTKVRYPGSVSFIGMIQLVLVIRQVSEKGMRFDIDPIVLGCRERFWDVYNYLEIDIHI